MDSISEDLASFVKSAIAEDNIAALQGKEAECKISRQLVKIIANICKKKPSISHSETVYNVKLIFPSLYAVLDWLEDHPTSPAFVPGEEELLSMSKQLTNIKKYSSRNIYKADGVVRLGDDVEVLLVETIGSFGLDNPGRLSFDNSKAMFGLLAMLKTIVKKYSCLRMSSFEKLKLLFLQPGSDALRLWTLAYSSNGTYEYKRVAKTVISEDYEERGTCFLEFVSFFLNLKKQLQEALDTVKQLKEEHDQKKSNSDESSQVLLSDLICLAIFKISYNKDSRGFCRHAITSNESCQ
ncbi:hypothetical protein BD560DRAFT_366531 [Blakeslea trispora]|nr:hypothetical protein BD560DRAFT_366531 [Blakeslea trispora]